MKSQNSNSSSESSSSGKGSNTKSKFKAQHKETLSHPEFSVLRAFMPEEHVSAQHSAAQVPLKSSHLSQRDIAKETGLSLGSCNRVIKQLCERGYLSDEADEVLCAEDLTNSGLNSSLKSAKTDSSASAEVPGGVPSSTNTNIDTTLQAASQGAPDASFSPSQQKKSSRRSRVSDLCISEAGKAALASYKVDNAIILAAGLSTRFAPISYERPKGLTRVRGEILIERQIRQLKEAGISDITVVVGYKKELFLYLEDRFQVKIRVNPDYLTRNNHSSLMIARDLLKNSYICSSDDYFCDNPFERYVWKAYYACSYAEGPTPEWCVKIGSGKRIRSVSIGGADSWIMLGHVYFDRAFSQHFVEILTREYEREETKTKLWEELYVEHIHEFDLRARLYPAGMIREFDSLDELREFDPHFIENVDSKIFDNIASVLSCSKAQICDIYPLSQGLTNLSFHFALGDDEYVYRHPGVGTQKIIDRKAERKALKTASELGLDNTFIFENEDEGWKISRFIKDAKNLDPHDAAQRKEAMQMARQLHSSKARVQRSFDFFEESLRYESLINNFNPHEVPEFGRLKEKAAKLKSYVLADEAPICLTHNDFFSLNFLIDAQGEMSLIDWEYAGMGDYAHDFGTFCVCCELDDDEITSALAEYFGRQPSTSELRHNFAYIAFAGWCWYLWALYKESEGEEVGHWMYVYWRYAQRYLTKALDLYKADDSDKEC